MAGNYYSNCSTLSTSGCFLYTNSALTNPASNGYYSNGTDCFTVSGGNGEITSVSSCSHTITVYAKVVQTGLNFVKIQYSTNGGTSWNDVGSLFDSTDCDQRGTFNVSGGSDFSIRAVDSSNTVYFHNSSLSTSCPGGSPSNCETTYNDILTSLNVAITVDSNIAC